MGEQILMCIRSVADDFGNVHAHKGRHYTLRERAKCLCGHEDFLTVQEVAHTLKSPCIPGDSWLPADHFVELNDPEALRSRDDEPYLERDNIHAPAVTA